MSRFDTTRWSVVLQTRGNDGAARGALESLCRIYRPPVLAYIRSRGYRDDVAEDLTQAFFARFVERAHYAEADPARGRFRAYLLTAIKRFLINAAIESGRVKRGGRVHFESFDATPADSASAPQSGEDPERVFEQAWALAVIEAALGRLRQEASAAGKLDLFDRLRDFLAEPPTEIEYARIADALGLRRNTIAVSVHRLRRRLRDLVRAEVAQTAADRAAFEIELGELRAALGVAGRAEPSAADA